jgi:hypothetical protein
MEVHHHSHHPKKWKEYITEFIMLFAAVTLGFFAENIREHQIIENHKNQNLIAMIDDLKQDSIEIDNRIEEYSSAIKQFEKIKDLSFSYSRQKINENELLDSIIKTYVKTRYGVGLFINNAAYKNTISSGGLSFINNIETKKLIAQYYEALYGKLIVNNTVLDEDTNEFMEKSFSFGFILDTTAKLPFQTRSNAEQLEDFKTIPSFRSKLTSPELRLTVNKMMGRCDYYLYIMQIAKELNNKLLKQLNNKEF